MSVAILRQWFVPAEGIDRSVIGARIQMYLGNDATVRPGHGTEGEDNGQPGYWIRAYRTLTTSMISDLQAESSRWKQEQQRTGTREPYVGSSSFHAANSGRPLQRRGGDSPQLADPYSAPPPSRERPAQDRPQTGNIPPGMPGYQPEKRGYPPQDTRYPPQDSRYPPQDSRYPPQDSRYPPQDSRYPPQPQESRYPPQDSRYPPQDSRYPPQDSRYPPQDSRYLPQDTAMGGMEPAYDARRPPPPVVTSSYGQESMYAYQQPAGDAPPGYMREGDYWVPIPGYQSGQPQGRSSEPSAFVQPGYGQPPARGDPRLDPRGDPRGDPRLDPRGDPRLDPRGDPRLDPRGDPRYPPEYREPAPRDHREHRDHRDHRELRDARDPSNAYPSPAATVTTINGGREREPVTGPPQPSSYGTSVPTYDGLGGSNRPMYPPGQLDPGYLPPAREPREPTYGRERAPAGQTEREHERDVRRRRLQ